MRAVHTGLAITTADWTVFVGILGSVMEELRVRPAEKKEFVELLERRFRPDVVEKE